MTSSFIPDFFLTFTHFILVVPLIILGYFFINKKIFLQAICLVSISMIINVALKTTFKIPLPSNLHKIGFAFPSGHTQFATVLYGWLAFNSKSLTWKILTAVLLIGVGYGLYYHHYHDIKDIVGGFTTGVVLIGIYYSLLTTLPTRCSLILVVTATLLMIYNAWMYRTIPVHADWAYLSLLVGCTLSNKHSVD